MAFVKGVSGNPNGRPKGASEMARIKNIILSVFRENEVGFREALQRLAKTSPLLFYDQYIAPFMPKEVLFSGDLELKNIAATNAEALEAIDALEERIQPKVKRRAKRA